MLYLKDKPKIYIAGKLNDDASNYIKNLHKMIKSGEEVRKQGFAIFVPGIDLLCSVVSGDWNYSDYFDNSQSWLKVSDGMYVLDNWRESKGTIREIKNAMNWKIPTFYKECNGLIELREYFYGEPDYYEPFTISKPKDLEEYLKCHT